MARVVTENRSSATPTASTATRPTPAIITPGATLPPTSGPPSTKASSPSQQHERRTGEPLDLGDHLPLGGRGPARHRLEAGPHPVATAARASREPSRWPPRAAPAAPAP